jgi:hypothetical protein
MMMRINLATAVCLGFLSVVQSALHGNISSSPGVRARAPEKALTACGALSRGGTRYVLQNDVQSAGTCFSIEADHVTLDLRGHTVTYATSEGTIPTFGVIAADCWYEPIKGNPCGGSHRYPEVLNGKIVQGSSAAPFSHALRFGQANNLTGVVVHNLEITIHAPDSIAIYAEYLPGGSDVYGNTIHNNVTVISSRTQFRGASIKLDEESAAKLPDQIHHNVVAGGAQLGIRDDNPAGTKIFGNDVSQNATYTNGFCIDAAGAGMQVYDNKCHPTHGRGIHTNQSGVQIHDNVVETIDSDQNQEYKGCEINGTYGIQVESDNFVPTGIRVYGNHVKVHAAACPAEAMRLTDLKDARIDITNNEFIAVLDSILKRNGADANTPAPSARGFSVGNVLGREVHFTGNLIQADTAMFHMDWDGGGSFLLENNRFQAGPHGKGTALLAEFGNGVGPSQNNYFKDNVYDGFSPEAAKFGDYVGDSWFAVTQSFTVRVVDQKGNAVRNAEVRIAFETGETSASLTDANGNARIVLPLARIAPKKAVSAYAEHRLSVKSAGCPTAVIVVDTNGPKGVSQTLRCP